DHGQRLRMDRRSWCRWCRRRLGGSCLEIGRRGHLPERAAREWTLAERMAADLPADPGELVDEDDLAGHLLVRERLGCVLAELRLELLRPVRAAGRDDERADEVAASLEIADPDHGRGGDRTVSREHALDLERSEGPAARRDDVL